MDREYANKAAQAIRDVQPQTGGSLLGAACGRQSSKALLNEHADRLRREAHQLEALAMQIDHLTPEAEAILYTLLSGHRR